MPSHQLLYEDAPKCDPLSSEFSDLTGDGSTLTTPAHSRKYKERNQSLMDRKLAVYEGMKKFKFGNNDFKLLDQIRKGKRNSGVKGMPSEQESKRLVALEEKIQYQELKRMKVQNVKRKKEAKRMLETHSQMSSATPTKLKASTSQ